MSYGVIAIIHIPGVSCDCDEAHFDGWYTYLSHAQAAFELFKKRYPEADVFIVKQERAEWREVIWNAPENVKRQIQENHKARCAYTKT